jgi:hypothetical protein
MDNNPRWMEDVPLIPDIEVPDHRPVKTGLLDSRGRTIRRYPNQMGFHRPGKCRG